MAAGQHDILIEPGANFQLSLVYKDSAGALVNLTGYTARMQVRPTKDSDTVLMSATTANGTITMGGTAGTITVDVPAADTLGVEGLKGVYDLLITSPAGAVTRLLQGVAYINQDVTR